MILINQLLTILQERIEAVLQASRSQEEKWVALENPVEADGTPAEGIADKIVMSVMSIQADASTGAFVQPAMGNGDLYPIASPPLHLDVYVLLTANFSGPNYAEGIGMLSRIISYFQEKPVFTRTDAPTLPDEMERLVVEFVSVDFAQANNIATLTGMKKYPFLLYRIRRVPFAGPAIAGVAPAIKAAQPKGDVAYAN